MKKLLLFNLVFMIFILHNKVTMAHSNYLLYEEIEIIGGKFLSEYTKKDYDDNYKYVLKRKFMGWNTYALNSDKKVRYKVESLFSYYNDGSTPIKYDYSYKSSNTSKTSINVSGNISYSLKGDIKKFKNGLDTQIKFDYQGQNNATIDESYSTKLEIDPHTQLNVYIMGEGKISNGLAARYYFWFLVEKGGYETFSITTQYYRLEKVRI